jgi:hypothetical protein
MGTYWGGGEGVIEVRTSKGTYQWLGTEPSRTFLLKISTAVRIAGRDIYKVVEE